MCEHTTVFLSNARPSNGDVATCVNERFHRFSLMANNYAGSVVVVGNRANFLYTLVAFPLVCLRQLRTLPQTIPWVATTPTYVSSFSGVRIRWPFVRFVRRRLCVLASLSFRHSHFEVIYTLQKILGLVGLFRLGRGRRRDLSCSPIPKILFRSFLTVIIVRTDFKLFGDLNCRI